MLSNLVELTLLDLERTDRERRQRSQQFSLVYSVGLLREITSTSLSSDLTRKYGKFGLQVWNVNFCMLCRATSPAGALIHSH